MDIESSNFIKKVIHLGKTGSTNMYAKSHEFSENTLITADSQTSGKGRSGKSWASPEGCGIYMSMVLFPDVKAAEIMQLTLICGIAVCEALGRICDTGFKIKWPNDIVFEGKKVCGILTECVCEGMNVKKAICGIGINVNTHDFPADIQDTATSLFLLCGKKFERETIIKDILEIFEKYYLMLTQKKGISDIIEGYKQLCVNIGREVVTTGNPQICGTATGISENGELIITDKSGKNLAVNSGEVSVRGIYGYV